MQKNLNQLEVAQVAVDLGTTPQKIRDVSQLNVNRIEEPWILRNYLVKALGQNVTPFTVLVGDYHQLWFLDTAYIDRAQLS